MIHSTQPEQPMYSQIIFKNLMISMRDGTRLATDVYRPALHGELADGTFPTILCRTPYVKGSKRYVEFADFFVPRGYVVVLQDLRGRGYSEGTGQYHHVANDEDGRDGYDTVEWIAVQPWSNGKVGAVGSSFAAVVQTRMAFERPPHLTAIWPDVTPINSYHHQAREGGAMQMHMFWALFLHAQDAQEIQDDPEAQETIWNGLRDLRLWLRRMPFQPGKTPLAVVPNLERILFDYACRGAYDEFWVRECNDFERNFHRHADIPATFTGGWFDPYSSAMTDYYSAMAQKNTTPQRLIMGPWTHMGMRDDATYTGDVDFGPDSVWGLDYYLESMAVFFDRWLKDEPVAVKNEPPIQLFVMGGGSGSKTPDGKLDHGGRWRTENEWPLARSQPTTYYFHRNGSLHTELPDEDSSPLKYIYDPHRPVPTLGGNHCGIMDLPSYEAKLDPLWRRYLEPVPRLQNIVALGPMHQTESPDVFGAQSPYPLLANRDDVLVFQTAPLAETIEVTGIAVVTLWISSSATDTDFTAKLIDVHPPNKDYPDGYHMNLVDSIIRTRYRDSWEEEALMTPGEVYRVRIQLPPTSNLYTVGHRIRIDISSSNFPRLDLNPNTGEPVGRHTHMIRAENIVYVDRERPSGVVLPVISL